MIEVTTTIAEVRPETPDAATLRLDLGGARFRYRPGQHVTIAAAQFGLGPGVSYFALASDGLDPGSIEISVKDRGDKAPSVATQLVRCSRPGESVVIAGPGGSYGYPEPVPPGVTGFVHVCAGSGVAPNRGMIRHALLRGWPQAHLLALQSRGEEDVFYRDEWRDLGARFGGRFRLLHAFSGRGEYLSEERLRESMRGLVDPERAMAFVCGPNKGRHGRPGFCDSWAARLPALGFDPSRIVKA
jgi:ferredoxin-NADP reductase